MNKWDIVLLSYPFTDARGTKVRPALIVSPNQFNRGGQDIVVLLITSRTENPSVHDVHIAANSTEFSRSGLQRDSLIRISRIITLHKSLVMRSLGSLGPKLQQQVIEAMRGFYEV